MNYSRIISIIDGLSEEERWGIYLWAVSCCMGCNPAEMEDVYNLWYGSSYMEILGKLGREVGGAYCDSTVDHDGEAMNLPSLILSHIEKSLNGRRDVTLSRTAENLLKYLMGSGLLDKFSEKRRTIRGIMIGYSLPYSFLELCFTHHSRALGNNITQEEAHEAIRELVKARVIIKCSSAGQDRYYAIPPQA